MDNLEVVKTEKTQPKAEVLVPKFEYRAIRLDKMSAGKLNSELPTDEVSCGYYCFAESLAQATEVFTKQFPDEKLSITLVVKPS